jgi:hypothetical protein
MTSKIMLQTLCITGLGSAKPYGRVTLQSPMGELSATLDEEEIAAIVALCDGASVRAAQAALVLLQPIVNAGTTQLVLEHQPEAPLEPASLPTGAFDDDTPF